MRNAGAGMRGDQADAETAPMKQPGFYQSGIDTRTVAEVWRRGSVTGSWLLDLTAAALVRSPGLNEFAGRVPDSGEGRWASIAVIGEGVPAPVLTGSLYSRFGSRDPDDFADKAAGRRAGPPGAAHSRRVSSQGPPGGPKQPVSTEPSPAR